MAMISNFKDRLQTLIDLKKISQIDVANGIQTGDARVSEWLSGKVKQPRRTTLQKLAAFFGCNLEWLATGNGQPFPDPNSPPPASTDKIHQGNGDSNSAVIKSQVAKGDNNIQVGGQSSHSFNHTRKEPLLSDLLNADEERLVLRLREVGGKLMIQKFLKQLDELENFIHKG